MFQQDYVIILCQRFNDKDSTILIRKNRPEWQRGLLNLPGGKIEKGETPEAAAIRELKEETGYNTSYVSVMGIIQDGFSRIYCVKSIITSYGNMNPRVMETEIPEWCDYQSIINDPGLIPNLKIIIPLMRAGKRDWIIKDSYRGEKASTHTVEITISTNNSISSD